MSSHDVSHEFPSETAIALVVGVLGVWRITHLVAAEDGPWDAVVRLRNRVGHGFWGELMDCFYCLSVWVAAPVAWLGGVRSPRRLLLWPALSAGAIMLERVTSIDSGSAVPLIIEEGETGEVEDVMLWQ
ncbi:MAG: DUF1360 domain-containing protein [bacterium]|nr:DUF1360 domain-containing protein [bacterium]